MKSLLPVVIFSIVLHGLVIMTILTVYRFFPATVTPDAGKVFPVDLVVDCSRVAKSQVPDSPEAQPAVCIPEPPQASPLAPPAQSNLPKPEKRAPPSPKKKRADPAFPPATVLSAPAKTDDSPAAPVAANGGEVSAATTASTDFSLSPGEGSGKGIVAASRGEGVGGGTGGESSGPAIGTIVDAKPLYKKNPPPPYPLMARKRNLEGTVVILARVSQRGRVVEAGIDTSSGHPLLDGAAVNAVKSWEFEPGRHGDDPVESFVKVPIRFELN